MCVFVYIVCCLNQKYICLASEGDCSTGQYGHLSLEELKILMKRISNPFWRVDERRGENLLSGGVEFHESVFGDDVTAD